MESRRRSFNLRRPVLNEISSRSSAGSDQSTDFILIEDDDLIVNNDRNINNNQTSNTARSIPEEEIIKTRGRKKHLTRCSLSLRDLSPNTLVNIKSPIKNSKNEDLLKFLRSPTPRKCKHRDDAPSVEVKRAKKSLIVDLEILNVKSTNSTSTTTPSTTGSNKKKASNKKTPNSKQKRFFNLRRSTNVKS